MKRFVISVLVPFIYLGFNSLCSGQDFIGSLITEAMDELITGSMENKRDQYDTISFSYALSLNYDPGLFETRTGFERQVKHALASHKFAEERDQVEKARILINAAEKSAARGKYKAAEYNFNRAKRILEKEEDRSQTIVYYRTLADLGLNASEFGEGARKIKILELTPPPQREAGRIVEGETPEGKAKELARLLHEEAKVI